MCICAPPAIVTNATSSQTFMAMKIFSTNLAILISHPPRPIRKLF